MTSPPALVGRTVVISANSAWNIINFRKPIIVGLLAAGFHVVVVAPKDGHEAAIESLGAQFMPIGMDPGGTSILGDARLLRDYMRVLRNLRPEAFLGFTIKPNIYGSIAARRLGIKVVNNISGLGSAFIRPGLLNALVNWLYRIALKRSATVFFQNRHDLDLFVTRGLVREDQARLIPGSGIDLDAFRPSNSVPAKAASFCFLFIGRLLRDKGIVEYAEAARALGSRRPDVEFAILGPAGGANPTAVPIEDVERWRDEGIVNWLGETHDVRPHIIAADCVVLPSYREGLPRSLLEASAMAKPMIATDVPGCRDVVEDGVNGIRCQVRSATSLATAMDAMLRLSANEREAMGLRAREKVEREFDQRIVFQAYQEALR